MIGYMAKVAIREAKQDVAKEIFEEIDQIIEDSKYRQLNPFGAEERYNPYLIKKHIAELKKKYTEGAKELICDES